MYGIRASAASSRCSGFAVDHDERRADPPQVTRDLTADPAEPANDVVVCVGVDHLLGAPLLEQAAELT